MKTDSIFYRLFKTFPRIFFELIGQPNIDISNYQFASVELKQTSFRIDGVFVPVPDSADRTVYFAEVQFQPDATFYRRFFSEIFLYLRQNPSVNLWRAVVIYPTGSIETSDVIPYQALFSSNEVQRIYLDRLPEAGSTSLGLRIVRLIVEREESAVTSARELISQTRQQVTDEATRREILELIETILLYKFTRLTREEIRQMFTFTESEFKQSRLYQSIKEEGLEEGKLEGKLEAVPRLLALGLSVAQIGEALDLTAEQVQQAAQNQSS
ncbi:Rpn family recombination-promoting nuclease/putative transposase [Argonema galeatum]|uniref:Rpn family recombination-promoting nuclease/putative transposase n=1 Tax=Argonema galeatum TaxID=2942762 RepID=UPI002012078D|nr:Rpn family recombination-promoting nuclease/putative transposase [Argonema galeatum A003/A1]